MDSYGLNTVVDGALLNRTKTVLARVTVQTSQFTRDKDSAVSGNTGPVSPSEIQKEGETGFSTAVFACVGLALDIHQTFLPPWEAL